MAVAAKTFLNIGIEKTQIPVRISTGIIKHFSEGLYSSPHKAIEELVSNSYDAGAANVWISIPSDLSKRNATIVVADDGNGMDGDGLTRHWIIGSSTKRTSSYVPPRDREPIGRFGIGKLATYVLASKFTHLTRAGKSILATTMDYKNVEGNDDSVLPEQVTTLSLPLRQLTPAQAREILGQWSEQLGSLSPETPTWTVAVLSGLHDMARQLSVGRLEWVLSTAMPLRDDFSVFVNGKRLKAAKLKLPLQRAWTLGKDPLTLSAQKKLQATPRKGPKQNGKAEHLLHLPLLGNVSGYFELYRDLLTTNKPAAFDRSHGFFVYSRGRLLNVSNEYFWIDSNTLKHGVFSRFRMVLNADALDADIRSTREGLREGAMLSAAQALCKACFDMARNLYEAPVTAPGNASVRDRFSGAPANLTTAPIIALAERTLSGDVQPRHLQVPQFRAESEKRAFLKALGERALSADFVSATEIVDDIEDGSMCAYQAETGILKINRLHPYIANFLSEYSESDSDLPVHLLAISEVTLEADLYRTIDDSARIKTIMERRDELLRSLARSRGRRTAALLAAALKDAATDRMALEKELRAAFESFGFDVIGTAKKGEADGIAVAHLGGRAGGKESYRVSLEAKSKEGAGTKVSAKTVGVSTVARHRDDKRYPSEHAFVLGPDFPKSSDEVSALRDELIADAQKHSPKTITCCKVEDLAFLLELYPQKRLNLSNIRELLRECRTHEETAAKILSWKRIIPAEPPYPEILEELWRLQQDQPDEGIVYGSLKTRLFDNRGLTLNSRSIQEHCRAMEMIVGPSYISAGDAEVFMSVKPAQIISFLKGSANRSIPRSKVGREIDLVPTSKAKLGAGLAKNEYKKPSKRTRKK